ncbi:MAG: hypothetical protein ACREA0_18100, partial [bacterium]
RQSDSERSTGGQAWTVGRDETLSQQHVVLWSLLDPNESGASSPAPWIGPAERRLEQLLTLEPGWDSYGGLPIDRQVASRVANVLHVLARAQAPQPQLVPLSSGGMHLEWYGQNIEMALEMEPDSDELTVFYADLGTGGSWQGPIGDEPEPLEKVLWRLSLEG